MSAFLYDESKHTGLTISDNGLLRTGVCRKLKNYVSQPETTMVPLSKFSSTRKYFQRDKIVKAIGDF
jgi:hypothetical protein